MQESALAQEASHPTLFRASLWFQAVLHRAPGDLGFTTGLRWVGDSPRPTPPAAQGRRSLHRPEGKGCLAGRWGPARVGAEALPKRGRRRRGRGASWLSARGTPGPRHGRRSCWQLGRSDFTFLSLSFLLCVNARRVDKTWCGRKRGAALSGGPAGSSPAPPPLLPLTCFIWFPSRSLWCCCGLPLGHGEGMAAARSPAPTQRPLAGTRLPSRCPTSICGQKTLVASSSDQPSPCTSGRYVSPSSHLSLLSCLTWGLTGPTLPAFSRALTSRAWLFPSPRPIDLALGPETPLPEACFSHRSRSRQSPSTEASGTVSGTRFARSG